MSTRSILLSIAAVILAFVGGFLVANSINRSELNSLRAEVESSRTKQASVSNSHQQNELSSEEIKAKIDQADANPTNLNYQKNLGLALARYGSMKEDPDLIAQAARILDRAASLAPGDAEIMLGQGNAAFDLGYLNKDNASLGKARAIYEQILKKGPEDAGVRTDLGMTYFLENPPQDDKAISEFKKAIAKDPKQTRALEFLIQALVREKDLVGAEKYLGKLREADPNDEALPGLTEQVGKSRQPSPE